MSSVVCTNCGRPYPDQGAPYRCPVCTGLYDFKTFPEFDPAQIDRTQPGIWRYQHVFGLPPGAPIVSLGEGGTPLVELKAFGKRVLFKLEFTNPTGSFKDRGSLVLLSFLCSRGVKEAVEDSSGNAGASFAAYAARAGVKATVYVPEAASGPKRRQIAAYGAAIVAVPGPRSKAAESVRKAAQGETAYCSHAYLPYNLPGYATLAYELVEQLGAAPGTVVCPAGQGGQLLGLARGFDALRKAGKIPKIPRLLGVQAEACAPMWALATYGPQGLGWMAGMSSFTEGETVAEGIRVRNPLRGDAVIQAVQASGGTWVSVPEEKILPGRDELARRGLYVEPTSGIVWPALEAGELDEPIVAILTGSGLKSSI